MTIEADLMTAEKTRALGAAYRVLRDRIVSDYKAVMNESPRPKEWATFFGSSRLPENLSEQQLLAALDRAFHDEIQSLRAR